MEIRKLLFLIICTLYTCFGVYGACEVGITGFNATNNCPNSPLTLQASGVSGTPLTYQWSNNSTNATLVFTPTYGDTMVTCISTFASCLADTDTVIIHVNPRVNISSVSIDVDSICRNGGTIINLSNTLTSNTGHPSFIYNWISSSDSTFATFTNLTGNQDPTAGATTANSIFYKLIVTDACNDKDTSNRIKLFIADQPSINVLNPVDFPDFACENANWIFSAGGVGSLRSNWYWYLLYPNSTHDSIANPSFNYTVDTALQGTGVMHVGYYLPAIVVAGCNAYSSVSDITIVGSINQAVTSSITSLDQCEVTAFTPNLSSTLNYGSMPGTYKWYYTFDTAVAYTGPIGTTNPFQDSRSTLTENLIRYVSVFKPDSTNASLCPLDSATFTYTIHEQPQIVSLVTDQPSYCVGGIVTASIGSVQGGFGNTPTYEWDVIHSNLSTDPLGSGLTGVLNYVNTTDSFIQLIYQNWQGIQTGCVPAIQTIPLDIHPDPVVTVTTDPLFDTICNNSQTILHSTLVGGVPSAQYIYTWKYWDLDLISDTLASGISLSDFNGQINADSLSPSSITPIYCTLTLNSNLILGCNSVSDTTLLNIKPTPSVTGLFGDVTICSAQSLPYSINSTVTSASQFLWSFNVPVGVVMVPGQGNGPVDSILLVSTLFNDTSVTYSVYATDGSAASCPGVVSTGVITVTPPPVLPTFNVLPSDTVCSGTQNLFISVNPLPNFTYHWTVADSTISIDSNPDSTYALLDFPGSAVSSSVSVYAQNSSSCQSSPITYDFYINSSSIDLGNSPEGLIVLKQPGNTLVCLKYDVDSYQWGADTGISYYPDTLSGEVYQSLSLGSNFDETHNYYWVILNDGACSTKLYFMSSVNRPPYSNGKLIEAQMPSIDHAEVNVFPNPSAGQFSLSLKGFSGHDVTYKVFNNLGKQIRLGNLSGDLSNEFIRTLNLSDLSHGLYQIRVENTEGQNGSTTIIIQ
ncbi:MAG: T9SS type A sorting domain-containing protein [Bacteroidetes bacterium]|nr:T9SS type A sorting domain-containing protein [Bacteroidota bacterium]